MSCFEAKYEYSDGTRMPTLAATSASDTAASPFSLATAHAASTISSLVAWCRLARRSWIGSPNATRSSIRQLDRACQGRRPQAAGRRPQAAGRRPQAAGRRPSRLPPAVAEPPAASCRHLEPAAPDRVELRAGHWLHDELRDAVPPSHLVVLLGIRVDEEDGDLPPVARVDQPRGVEAGHPVAQREPAADR